MRGNSTQWHHFRISMSKVQVEVGHSRIVYLDQSPTWSSPLGDCSNVQIELGQRYPIRQLPPKLEPPMGYRLRPSFKTVIPITQFNQHLESHQAKDKSQFIHNGTYNLVIHQTHNPQASTASP